MNPLKGGIGKYKVVLTIGTKRRRIRIDPFALRIVLLRGNNHFRRTVQPYEIRTGPPPTQCVCAVARAAADINNRGRVLQRNARNEIKRRLCSLVAKLQVLVRIPNWHGYFLLDFETKVGNRLQALGVERARNFVAISRFKQICNKRHNI